MQVRVNFHYLERCLPSEKKDFAQKTMFFCDLQHSVTAAPSGVHSNSRQNIPGSLRIWVTFWEKFASAVVPSSRIFIVPFDSCR